MSKIKWILILIVIVAFALRVYKIDSIPPSLTWDEAAVGYNAFTVANYRKDEYGKLLPLYFRSFGEDKQPIHIYVTALFVKILGLSEFSVRLPTAIFGTLNVLLIFYLVKIMFDSEMLGLLSSLSLAISPQNIFFSRFNHEANFALFFFMLGLFLFFKSIKQRRALLPFSLLAFFTSTISYHAAEIIIPPIILFLFIFYFVNIYKDKTNLFITIFIAICLFIFTISQPRLFGISRYNQTVQGKGDIEKTEIFKKTHNLFLGRLNLAWTQYLWHFDLKYLFISGGTDPRLSSLNSGEFYKFDAPFLVLGLIYLLLKRSRVSFLILFWAGVAPLASAFFSPAPQVGRASFMMGSWNIISASGLFFILSILRKRIFKLITLGIIISLFTFSLAGYLNSYFTEFPKRYAIDWQYGMKQVVVFVKDNPNYEQVYITDVRAQPYIFFLFYLKQPLPEYLNSMVLNNSNSYSYNNVSFFGKYSFGSWDSIESLPIKGVLYVVSPSEYDGLKYKKEFDIKKIVYYPNGTDAFFIISSK